MKHLILTLLALILSVTDLTAQSTVNDLGGEIGAGRVKLMKLRGNGSSSGAAIHGVLANLADTPVKVDVHLAPPFYLINSGAGQNMVALQVYLRNGHYRSDGIHSYITLAPKELTEVSFVAYCADFEKENPSATESFTMGALPTPLAQVVTNINAYAAEHPEADFTCAAQVAVWLVKGEKIAAIKKKFKFTPEDQILAERLARSPR